MSLWCLKNPSVLQNRWFKNRLVKTRACSLKIPKKEEKSLLTIKEQKMHGQKHKTPYSFLKIRLICEMPWKTHSSIPTNVERSLWSHLWNQFHHFTIRPASIACQENHWTLDFHWKKTVIIVKKKIPALVVYWKVNSWNKQKVKIQISQMKKYGPETYTINSPKHCWGHWLSFVLHSLQVREGYDYPHFTGKETENLRG